MPFKLKKSVKKLIHVQRACKSFIETLQSNACKALENMTTIAVSPRQKTHIRHTRQRFTMTHSHDHFFQRDSIDELYVTKSCQLSRESTSRIDEELLHVTSTSTSTIRSRREKKMARIHDSLPKEKKKSEDEFQTQEVLRGIDEKAEEFILKVREHLKLEREQSITDYHDMLQRSV
uniref:uncharacterized protein LOC122602428 n=1 Tax=Erigeron canadensis TaxID=72917 RepID=UPI001CB9C043|nr:uncharacterized protein LOC122602428 [Erigeron canadensis]